LLTKNLMICVLSKDFPDTMDLGLSARLNVRRLLKLKEEQELEYIRKGVERMQPSKDFAMPKRF